MTASDAGFSFGTIFSGAYLASLTRLDARLDRDYSGVSAVTTEVTCARSAWATRTTAPRTRSEHDRELVKCRALCRGARTNARWLRSGPLVDASPNRFLQADVFATC